MLHSAGHSMVKCAMTYWSFDKVVNQLLSWLVAHPVALKVLQDLV